MNYISCFIKKEQELKKYDFKFKNHMYKLHEKYKTELKPNNKIIDKKFVIDYFNNLHPAQQMFVINYMGNRPTRVNSGETAPHVRRGGETAPHAVNSGETAPHVVNSDSFIMVN